MMRACSLVFLMAAMAIACQEGTSYHTVYDIDDHWRADAPLTFRITIDDTVSAYTIFCDLRNTSDYAWSRFFVAYTLRDSTGLLLDSLMAEQNLFDPITGKPLGKGGIGDLYEHEFPLRRDFRFPHSGTYTVRLSQMMRTDSLTGITSAGLRLQRAGQ